MSVDLYTILHLIGVFDSDVELVYLRKPEDVPKHRPSEILTPKQVKEKYDLRKTKVVGIKPYFCYQEYKGILLTITEGQR